MNEILIYLGLTLSQDIVANQGLQTSPLEPFMTMSSLYGKTWKKHMDIFFSEAGDFYTSPYV